MKHIIAAAALPLALLLSACGGGNAGPSEQDARAALKAAALANPSVDNNTFYRMIHDYTGDRAALSDPGQLAALLDKPKIELSSCSAATNAAGYYCDYRISWKDVLPLPPNITIPDWSKWFKGRFFQAGGTWNFEEQKQ